MKLITRDTDYALRSLAYIASHKAEKYTVSELVKELKIPRPFLRKILQALNRKKILASSRGQNGGFSLVASPEKISLADVMEIFQGPLRLNKCMFKKRLCPNRNFCELRAMLCGIEKGVFVKLKSTTIASLVKGRPDNG